MKYRQKIDKAAADQLSRMVAAFPGTWGTAEKCGIGMKFSFDSFLNGYEVAVAYDARKQLLGGVYSMVFSLICEETLWDEEGTASLHDRGSFIKGAAYFAQKGESGDLAQLLHGDAELMGLLGELDLLSMKVSVKDKKLDVRLSPLGGAYTYTVFPPMKYGGILPDKELEKIHRVLTRIAALFECTEVRKAAGAEV